LWSEPTARGTDQGNAKFKNKDYAGAETEFRNFLHLLEGQEGTEPSSELVKTVELLGLSLAHQQKSRDLVILLNNYCTKLSRDQVINMVSSVDVIRRFTKRDFQIFTGILAQYRHFRTKDRQILLDRCIRSCRRLGYWSEAEALLLERLKISEGPDADAEATSISRMLAEVYFQKKDLRLAESVCSRNLHTQITLLGKDHHYCQLSIELFARILEAKQSEPSITALANGARQLLNDKFLGTLSIPWQFH
jgi:hypothetical protein